MPGMLCGCKHSTHKLLDMLQHEEVCWIPSFGGQLLQHNANHLKYAAVLMFSLVSTACKSCKTRKKRPQPYYAILRQPNRRPYL